MNEKMKSAIIGGVVLGILSAIPFVNIVNACCCAWAILGGLLAGYLWIKKSPTPVSVGDGATIGVIAGLVGAVIYFVIGVPLGLAVGNTMMGLVSNILQSQDPQQAEIFRRQLEAGQSIGQAIIGGLIGAILLTIFSTIGGLLSVPLFEKRKGGPAAPPPPPGFGGPQGGPYQQPGAYNQPGGYGTGM
jgi:hypothetical protein